MGVRVPSAAPEIGRDNIPECYFKAHYEGHYNTEPELLNRYQFAPMVESVDAEDSKSFALRAWGFKSLSGHQCSISIAGDALDS